MDAPKITFEDGAAYERMMGTWSRIAGEHFVDRLQPRPGMHWIDVGCGNGAFTELLIDRCAAAKVAELIPHRPRSILPVHVAKVQPWQVSIEVMRCRFRFRNRRR